MSMNDLLCIATIRAIPSRTHLHSNRRIASLDGPYFGNGDRVYSCLIGHIVVFLSQLENVLGGRGGMGHQREECLHLAAIYPLAT